MGQMQHVLQPKLLDIIATPLTLFKNHLQSLVFFIEKIFSIRILCWMRQFTYKYIMKNVLISNWCKYL